MRVKSIFCMPIAALLTVACLNLPAQDYEKGIKYLQMDQPETAAKIFNSLLQSNPNDAKGIYGLGEYYFKVQNYDSALILFQKYFALNPEDAFAYVALGKTLLNKGNNIEAEAQFTLAKKKDKKNSQLYCAVANAYIEGDVKDILKAKENLVKANELNSKNASFYLIDGKVDILNSDHNSAAGKFEQALLFDSTLCEAYLLLSNIYTNGRNYKFALNYITTAQRIDPEYILAYKKLGEIYYETAKYKDAANAYSIYLGKADHNKDVREKYAFCLFFDKNYSEALSEIHKLVKDDTTNHVLMRLMAYINYEKGEYAKGLELMDKFFATVKSEKIISLDYEYNAKLLSQLNKDSLAILSYQKAFALDSLKTSLLSDIAKTYGKLRDYANSANFYSYYIGHIETPQPSDYFLFGKALYNAGNFEPLNASDSLNRSSYLIQSDSIFKKVIAITSSSHLGYFWNARVNSLIDSESTEGRAKPYYEKAIEIMSANPEKFKRELTEAFSYLGYYYFLNDNKEQSKLFWEKVLAIDPNHEQAISSIKMLKELK